jgi:hypothetical protein
VTTYNRQPPGDECRDGGLPSTLAKREIWLAAKEFTLRLDRSPMLACESFATSASGLGFPSSHGRRNISGDGWKGTAAAYSYAKRFGQALRFSRCGGRVPLPFLPKAAAGEVAEEAG